jgi:hypothetical protein
MNLISNFLLVQITSVRTFKIHTSTLMKAHKNIYVQVHTLPLYTSNKIFKPTVPWFSLFPAFHILAVNNTIAMSLHS